MSKRTLSALVTEFKRDGETRDECEERILNAAHARLAALSNYKPKGAKPKARKAAKSSKRKAAKSSKVRAKREPKVEAAPVVIP